MIAHVGGEGGTGFVGIVLTGQHVRVGLEGGERVGRSPHVIAVHPVSLVYHARDTPNFPARLADPHVKGFLVVVGCQLLDIVRYIYRCISRPALHEITLEGEKAVEYRE